MSIRESPMLLLTNDDGYDAPGLLALRRACDGLGDSRVIAPLTAQSGCGHRVTTHETLEVSTHENGVLAVSGTPADCVRLAIDHLAPDVAWVLAGVNAGGNLGTDVFHSGTVAAVREGVIHGLPGIAVSHYIARGRSIDWERAARWTHEVLHDLLARPWRPGTFWNVNLPHPAPGAADPDIVFCPLDPSPLPLRYEVEPGRALYRGDYQQRPRRDDGDVAVCFGGGIAVSLVRVFDADLDGTVGGLSG
ncbi:5'/3'-nucleotidase SurE [Paludisphaera borealis]|nr:5'/3'-nucleotidase SurE [Paludisphaera borealis]